MKSKMTQVWGGLGLVGGITAVPLLIAFYMIDGGAVGTAAYQTYELLNRLMAVALLFMAMGWLGVWRVTSRNGHWAALIAFIGITIISVGTAAEFWLYSDLPYAGQNMRQVAFTAVSIGGWLLIIGATTLGISIWRSHIWPRWSAILFILTFPIELAAFFWLDSPFATAVLFALALAWLLLNPHTQPKLNI